MEGDGDEKGVRAADAGRQGEDQAHRVWNLRSQGEPNSLPSAHNHAGLLIITMPHGSSLAERQGFVIHNPLLITNNGSSRNHGSTPKSSRDLSRGLSNVVFRAGSI